jgi:hypothetical protein
MCGKALVGKICQLMDLDWEVVVKHTYREARHNFSVKDEDCFFQDCSSFCNHILDVDVKVSVSPRSVFV